MWDLGMVLTKEVQYALPVVLGRWVSGRVVLSLFEVGGVLLGSRFKGSGLGDAGISRIFLGLLLSLLLSEKEVLLVHKLFESLDFSLTQSDDLVLMFLVFMVVYWNLFGSLMAGLLRGKRGKVVSLEIYEIFASVGTLPLVVHAVALT